MMIPVSTAARGKPTPVAAWAAIALEAGIKKAVEVNVASVPKDALLFILFWLSSSFLHTPF